MDSRRWFGWLIKKLQSPCKIQIRIRGDQRGKGSCRPGSDNSAGLCRIYQGSVLGIREKSQFTGSGSFEACDSRDGKRGIARDGTAKLSRNLTESEGQLSGYRRAITGGVRCGRNRIPRWLACLKCHWALGHAVPNAPGILLQEPDRAHRATAQNRGRRSVATANRDVLFQGVKSSYS